MTRHASSYMADRNAAIYWDCLRGRSAPDLSREHGISVSRVRQIAEREASDRRERTHRRDSQYLAKCVPELAQTVAVLVDCRFQDHSWSYHERNETLAAITLDLMDRPFVVRLPGMVREHHGTLEFLHSLALAADALGVGPTLR
jgi:hypothetical protein